MGYSWEDDTRGESDEGRGADYHSARGAYTSDSSSSSRSSSRSGGSSSGGSGSASSSSGRSSESRSERADHDFSSVRGKTPPPSGRPEVAVNTMSTHPIVVCMDNTGSFIVEVCIVLEKLPLLGGEVERYMPKYSICFSLIGDVTHDRYGFQVRDFDSGEALDGHIKELYPEGGGGDEPESYNLAAYYFSHHCEMPNATKPIFIWVLDAPSRSILRAQDVKEYIGDDVQSDLDSVGVLRELTKKFNVWAIVKAKGALSFWKDIFGEQSVVPMEDPRDIIELIIGIIAAEAGEFEDFEKRSSKRHSDRPDRISRVMSSMRSAKEKSKAAKSGDGHSMRSGAGMGSAKPTGSMRSRKLV